RNARNRYGWGAAGAVAHRAAVTDGVAPSAAPRLLDRGDIDFSHVHHRRERALGLTAAGGKRLRQHSRRDLPRQAPFGLAPAASALLAAIVDDRVPIADRLFLILGGDLEGERFIGLELR